MTVRRIALLLCLLALGAAAVAAGAAATHTSSASYTTTSETDVTASAATAADWLHVYSQATDPDGLTGYAHQQDLAAQPLIATGQDAGLAMDWGTYPDLNKTFVFSRVLTIETPVTFPIASVTQVTVTATPVADPGGTQPFRNMYLRLSGQGGTSTSITLRADQKAQLDITLRTKKNPWDDGDVFRPRVVLTLTYAGGPATYYQYDYTTLLHII